MKKKPLFINSALKSFRVLEILSSEGELSVSEVSKKMNFRRSMGHRILKTLKETGYVSQNFKSKKYGISVKLFELGNRFIEKNKLAKIARQVMEDLAQKIGESINLGIMDGPDIICIDRVLSNEILKMDQPIGGRIQAQCTGFGKAILAFLPEEKIKEIFKGISFRKYTKNSLTDYEALIKETAMIRERGFSTDNEEGVYGVRCVGAPIFESGGNVIAGLSIAGPSVRIQVKDFKRLGKLVANAAQGISQGMGWRAMRG